MEKDSQFIINIFRPIYVFEYYITNGIIDYIMIVLAIIYMTFFNSFSIPFDYPNLQVGGFDIVGYLIGLIVTGILLITIFIWPLTDIFAVIFFPHYALIIIAYVIIKLFTLIFYHDDLYFFIMDYIEDYLAHIKEYIFLDAID